MTLPQLLISALLLLSPQDGAATAWTWTLYESDGLTLAQEVPDTDRLNVTLECDPGSHIATLTLYHPGEPMAAFAQVRSGDISATVQSATASRGTARLNLRTDHPVMAAFAANGSLAVSSGDAGHQVNLPRPHRSKLRRFVELCNG